MDNSRKIRVWLYCRVASPDISALENQKALLSFAAEKQGFQIVGTTAEQVSGMTMRREGLSEVSRAVEQGLIDVLLITKIERLGRNSFEVVEYIAWLRKHGVSVCYANGI